MKLFPSISPELAAWAQKQPVFFTASAPTHAAHVNVSPKGLPASHFAVLSPNQCVYIDRTGSGCETIAHAYENGRLTLMFISFGNTPRILRFFCRARVVEWDAPEFADWVARIVHQRPIGLDGARAIILCDVFEVQTSCGFGVPRVRKALYAPAEEYVPASESGPEKVDETSVFEDRPTLADHWKKRADENKIGAYQQLNNTHSIDGLPGLRAARRDVGERLWFADARARSRKALQERDGLVLGFLLAVLLYGAVALGTGLSATATSTATPPPL